MATEQKFTPGPIFKGAMKPTPEFARPEPAQFCATEFESRRPLFRTESRWQRFLRAVRNVFKNWRV